MVDVVHTGSFGPLLRRYRIAAGLTQEELAERAGVSVRRLGDLERGMSHTPRPDTVALLARALALSAQDDATFVEASRRVAPSGSAGAPGPGGRAAPATPPFVGRTPELALIERHVMGQGPPLLVLAGEPGMGKTRLLHAAIPRALMAGLHVLEGGCQRRGGQAPFAPLLEAVQGHIAGRSAAQLRADLRGCAWLVRLLPELAGGPIEALPAWTVSPPHERRLMGAAVQRFLGNVAGPQGTLLVLDDLQWADPDALDLLATLVRAAAEISLRVVAAYRQTEVRAQDALSAVLADLAQGGLATQRRLSPLAPAETAHLLAGLLEGRDDEDSSLRAALIERTGGVPFFVVSCAQGLRLTEVEQGQAAVPWDVSQSIRQRVAALPEEASEVLGIAAVIGRAVPRTLLVGLAGRAEEQILTELDALCRGCLLEEHGADAYQFAHDIIREVVEADLGAGRRTVLHRRIAEALERQAEGSRGAAPVEALAYHYARSDQQEKALLYLEQAGAHARRQGAHTTAATCYHDLVASLDRLVGRALEAARARELLAEVLRYMGQLEAAAAVLERAETAYRTAGEVEGLRRTLALIGRVQAFRATPAEGLARIEPLMEGLTQGAPTAGMAALHAALAWLFLAGGRQQESVRAAERAVDLARAVGDDRVVADAEVRRGAVLVSLGRTEEARGVLESALPPVLAVGDLDPLLRLYNSLARIYLRRGAFDQSSHYFDRAITLDQQHGDPLNMSWTLSGMGELLYYRGDWEAARAHFERAVELVRSREWFLLSAIPLVCLARLHVATGEGAQAVQCLEEAMAKSRGRTNRGLWLTVPLLLAEQDLLDGRPRAALERVAHLPDHPQMTEGAHPMLLLPLLAWAYIAMGDDKKAAAVVAEGIRQAIAQDDRLALADALRVNGMVLARQHRWREAAEVMDEGLALTHSLPYPYAEARLLHIYAEMHATKGEPAARERLEEALSIFRRLGAREDVERAEQTLANLMYG